MHGDVVRLAPRDDVPAWNVEVLVRSAPDRAPAPQHDRSGPPQVATAAYRRNWQAVFGGTEADAAPADPGAQPELN